MSRNQTVSHAIISAVGADIFRRRRAIWRICRRSRRLPYAPVGKSKRKEKIFGLCNTPGGRGPRSPAQTVPDVHAEIGNPARAAQPQVLPLQGRTGKAGQAAQPATHPTQAPTLDPKPSDPGHPLGARPRASAATPTPTRHRRYGQGPQGRLRLPPGL